MLGDNMHKLIEKINNFKPWNKKWYLLKNIHIFLKKLLD
jgi:hypothetical protein